VGWYTKIRLPNVSTDNTTPHEEDPLKELSYPRRPGDNWQALILLFMELSV